MIHQLQRILLDVPPEPSAAERFSKSQWPLVIVILALAALIVWYYGRRKRKDKGPADQ